MKDLGGKSEWMVFSLRERRSGIEWKEMLRNAIVRDGGFGDDDVRYFEDAENPSMENYFLVRERTDEDYQRVCDIIHESVDFYCSVPRISEEECDKMFGIGAEAVSNVVNYGDFVRIERGKYRKLNGIALRRRKDGKIEVGLKFCFGPLIEVCDPADLRVTGNLFDYVKMPI